MLPNFVMYRLKDKIRKLEAKRLLVEIGGLKADY